MKYHRAEAIILRRHNVAEADRLLVMISPDLGKHVVKARGVRKGSSKLAGHLELFNRIDLNLTKGRQLDIVTGAKTLEIYSFDRSDIERVALGYLFLEIIDKLTQEHLPSPDLFDLLTESLFALGGKADIRLLKHYFFIKALKAIGQEPYLDGVGASNRYYMRLDEGRVKVEPDSGAIEIDPRAIKLWRLIYVSKLDRVLGLKGADSVIGEAQRLIEEFYNYHLNLRFFSESILRS